MLSVGMLPGLLLRPDLKSRRRVVAGATKTGVKTGVSAERCHHKSQGTLPP